MYGIKNLLGMVAMAEAMSYSASGLLKSGGGYKKSLLTPKQWRKRKTRLKMQSDSRKLNRK